jgi:hypothetical protein
MTLATQEARHLEWDIRHGSHILRAIFRYNYLDKCNGDGETVTNKSSGNMYFNNSWVDNNGSLVLRHGDSTVVLGNYFEKSGLRVGGADHFTGDIMDYVKRKLHDAAVVVAELTGSNPNVYLEVGYAWGIGKPTILLARHNQELLFDVRGHRCPKWRNIQDCKKLLVHELVSLKRESDIENYFVQFSLGVATEFS